jgi:FHS family L-fucose permease-like MFS transporter
VSKQFQGPLAILVSVFFFWGFVAAGNTILIPVFKRSLELQQWQAQLIEFCFYIAYTVGSLAYYLIGRIRGKDILNTIGYKNGLALGLVISAFGAFLFLPAAYTESFGLMLTGLFIVGLGFSLQQTAANPLALRLGSEETASSRLSMAGGINNVGTTIAPVLLSYAIFGATGTVDNTVLSLDSVKLPYLILGGAFIAVAVLIRKSTIPNVLSEDVLDTPELKKLSLGKYPELWLGMIAIFVYVGVEVSTAANLSEYLKVEYGKTEDEVSPYVALFWGSLMVGRWAASVSAFGVRKKLEPILRVIVPLLAFGLYLLIISIKGFTQIKEFLPYLLPIGLLILVSFLTADKPSRQLALYSLLGITSLFVGMFSSGMLSIFGFISVGLFCSTLWPCIFDLATRKLGAFRNEGSSFLIMMIMGGGIVSLLQGYLSSENLLGIRFSYFVGVACFVYLLFYGLYTRNKA